MKKFYVLIFTALIAVTTLFAQYEQVIFDYEKANFNENNALPAETYFTLTGQAPLNVKMVDVEVYKGKSDEDDDPEYTNTWKRLHSNVAEVFSVPMNYKLRGGSNYDFTIKYYRRVSDGERKDLRNSLYNSIDGYISQAFVIDGKKMKIASHRRIVMSDLDEIVNSSLGYYKTKNGFTFNGFSDIVKTKIKNMEKMSLKAGKMMVYENEVDKNREKRGAYYNQIIGELQSLIKGEVDQIINGELLVVEDEMKVNNYPTKETRNVIAVNAGYGGIFYQYENASVDVSVDTFDVDGVKYADAPYVGVSFPFANSAFSGKFASNLSITTGIFLDKRMETEGLDYISGPVIDYPIHLGFGYKVFQFIRINAGGTLTETFTYDYNKSKYDSKIGVDPYVGLSAEINLWLGLGNKNK